MTTIAERIKTILARDFDADDVANERLLRDDIGLDSLDLVELSMTIEDEFDIAVHDSDFAKLLTVGDVIAFVDAAQKERARAEDEVVPVAFDGTVPW